MAVVSRHERCRARHRQNGRADRPPAAGAGHDVRAWNRTLDKAEDLGATVAREPAEAVDGADVVITMLADGATVESVVPPLPPAVLWVAGMPMDSPYAHLKGGKILSSDYSASFPLRLALKDARLALAAAEEAGVALPVGKLTEERLAAALALGHGDKDIAAMYLAAKEAS